MKSNVITISETPTSGKEKTVDLIVKRLKQNGYKSENIHIFNAKEEYKNYFQAVVDIINNNWNKKRVEKILSEYPELKNMGTPILDSISAIKKVGINPLSLNIANANSLPELNNVKLSINQIIDSKTEELGKEIAKEENENDFWIVESKLALKYIPDSFSIKLTSRDDIAAKRFVANNKGKNSCFQRFDNIVNNINNRKKYEEKMYKEIYNIDLQNEKNYNIIIDTSFAKTQDIVDVIFVCLDRFKNEKPFTQKWTSPKTFLPTQGIKETWSYYPEFKDSIEKEGIYPDSSIPAIDVNGILIQMDGHHRTAAMGELGKTLVPYELKTEKYKGKIYMNGEDFLYGLNISNIHEHEEFLGSGSYNEVYPGLMDKIKERQQGKK